MCTKEQRATCDTFDFIRFCRGLPVLSLIWVDYVSVYNCNPIFLQPAYRWHLNKIKMTAEQEQGLSSNVSRSPSPASSAGGLDLFSEPEDFRPSTPPPQVLRVPYDFSGSNSTTSLETAEESLANISKDDDLRIHLLGSHPLWGHHLWNASLDISRYLQRHASSLVKGKSVLELGAAAGVPSIVCAREGAQCVVATDYPDQPLIDVLVKNIESNVRNNSKTDCHAVAEGYLWGSDPAKLIAHLPENQQGDGFDLLLLSDLIFNHQAHPALLQSMDACLSRRSAQASLAPLTQEESTHHLTHDEAHPLFPDQLPRGEFTKEHTHPDAPCVLVFFTSHRPHLAHRDMEFFLRAQEAGWEVERVGRWTRDVGINDDIHSENT